MNGDPVGDLKARQQRLADLTERATSTVAAAVQGHRGDSTVTALAAGSGVTVEITGPDAAQHTDDVRRAARAALRTGGGQ